jgi:hypothetical protein
MVLQGKVIRSMRAVTKTGYLDPLTGTGTLVTNNISTSCCKLLLISHHTLLMSTSHVCSDASFPHQLANLALLPARLLPRLVLDNQQSQNQEGTRTYVSTIKMIGRYGH